MLPSTTPFQLRSQEQTSPDSQAKEKLGFSKTQASIVKENFQKQIQADARRRLVYYQELVADGHAKRARSYLENFLQIYPDFQEEFQIRKLLADSLQAKGQNRLAAEAYVEAYASSPDTEQGLLAYLSAARIFSDLGQKKRARTILNEILRKRPSSKISRIAERELSSFPLSNFSAQKDSLPNTKAQKANDQTSNKKARKNADSESPLIPENNSTNESKSSIQLPSNSKTQQRTDQKKLKAPNKTQNKTRRQRQIPKPDTRKSHNSHTRNSLVGEGIE